MHVAYALHEVYAWVTLLLACKINSRAPWLCLVSTTWLGPGLPLATPQEINPIARPTTWRLAAQTHTHTHKQQPQSLKLLGTHNKLLVVFN